MPSSLHEAWMRVKAGFSLPVGAMLGGLGAFILAEVFAYGTRLREDVEATV